MREQDDRIRWRCRRGLLELDLVLSKFLNTKYASLSEAQRTVFMDLLSWSDNDLWDLLSGRTQSDDPKVEKLVELFD